MRKFLDYETGDIVGYDDLQKEYEELKANNNTEAKSFSQYLSNCMWYNNGTLKEV